MAVKALDLFQAYSNGNLPKDGGYIVSSFLSETSAYSRFEIIAYSAVKSLYLSSDGLTFQSDGNKLFILVEPANYPKKYIEPFRRDTNEHVPHRFNEMEIFSAKNQSKVMVSKEPIITYTSFTILKPTGINFAFVFYNLPDVLDSIKMFYEKTLNQEAKVPAHDAKNAAELIVDGLKKFTIF
jgi:hypothetical protein